MASHYQNHLILHYCVHKLILSLSHLWQKGIGILLPFYEKYYHKNLSAKINSMIEMLIVCLTEMDSGQ